MILDLEMPGLNDFETCEATRASEGTRELPVLIATGLTDSETLPVRRLTGLDELLFLKLLMTPWRRRHITLRESW